MLDKYHTNCITLEQLRSPIPDTSAWNEDDDVMEIFFGMTLGQPEGAGRQGVFNGIVNHLSPYPAQVRYSLIISSWDEICPVHNSAKMYPQGPGLPVKIHVG